MPEGLAFGVLDGLRGVEVRILLVRFASLPCNICNVAVVTFGVSIAVVGVPEAYRRAELAVRGCGRERCRLRGDAYVAGLGLDLADAGGYGVVARAGGLHGPEKLASGVVPELACLDERLGPGR